MTTIATFKLLAMLGMLGIAVFTDVRERRIPNQVTAGGALIALVLSAVEAGGLPGAALLGMTVALALTLPLFALGVLGAGDAKLLAAVGAFMGIGALFPVVVYAAVAGGVLGIASATRRGMLVPVLINSRNALFYMLTFGHAGARKTLFDQDAQTIPYGVAIAAGAVAAWFDPLALGGLL